MSHQNTQNVERKLTKDELENFIKSQKEALLLMNRCQEYMLYEIANRILGKAHNPGNNNCDEDPKE